MSDLVNKSAQSEPHSLCYVNGEWVDIRASSVMGYGTFIADTAMR